MKIRTDFVTNSSSSCFFVSITFNLKDEKVIEWSKMGGDGETTSEIGEIYISVSPKQLGTAKTIKKMIEMLKKGVSNNWDGEGKIFDKEDPNILEYKKEMEEDDWEDALSEYSGALENGYEFISSLEKINSMDEIESITITGEEDGRYDSYYRSVTYDRTTGKVTVEVEGEEFEKNGGSGGDLCFSDVKWYEYYNKN